MLPIYGQMREFLLLAKQRRDQEHPACPWVFNRNGQPMYFRHRTWNDLVKDLGVPEVHFHDLRRTAATNMIEAGFSEKEVMAITGHKTDRMFRRYHIIRSHRIQTIGEKMEAFYKSAEEELKTKAPGTLPGTDLTEATIN